MEEKKKKVAKIVIDKTSCIGCGTCVVFAEKAFEINKEGVSEVKDTWQEEDVEKLLKVAKSCPVNSVSLFDEEGVMIK